MASERNGLAASFAALGSLLVASSCCLPIGTLIAAAGTAGASAMLDRARSWLMPLSAILILYGFYQMYGARVRRPLWSQFVLWISAAMVTSMFLFPQQIAILIAGITRESRPVRTVQPALLALDATNLDQLRDQFNAAADRIRIVTLLSPT